MRESNIEAVEAPSGRPVSVVTGVDAEARHASSHGLTVYDALLLSMICVWAANPAALKWVLQYMDPLVLNSLRFALATAVPVLLLALSKEGFKWRKGDGWKVFGLGIVGHGLYQLCFIVAVSNTLAGNVALIISTSPAFIAIFGALLGYERVRAYTWIGVTLSLSGVALVIVGSGETIEFGSRLVGDLLAVLTTMMWGLYSVLSQPLLTRYSSVKLNALTMPWGAGFLLLVGAPAIARTAPGWGSVPPVAWAIVVASGLLAVSFSYIVWYKGIQKLGATRTSAYANLVPVMAAFIAYFALGEPLTGQFWVGMVLVLLGVSLARFGGRLLRRVGRDG